MTSNELIKRQRLIRRTNRIMSRFFAIDGEKEAFSTWLKTKNLPIQEALHMSVDEFIDQAAATNTFYQY